MFFLHNANPTDLDMSNEQDKILILVRAHVRESARLTDAFKGIAGYWATLYHQLAALSLTPLSSFDGKLAVSCSLMQESL